MSNVVNRMWRVELLLLAALAVAPISARAQGIKIDSETFAGLYPRAIGPAVTSGRIAALDAVQGDRLTVYVGAAGGGVWKSSDGGVSFKSVFDKYPQSIGDVRIDPTNKEIVWVGTGESWTRNSVSIGEGIFKTVNGGGDWQKMGLDSTERISKIVIDPKQHDRVFVAALGHLWNDHPARGVYRTLDGGKSWQKVLYVDAGTGCSDLAMDPSDSNTLYASMWTFRRKPWAFSSGGTGSALYKTTDGGATWTKLAKGLPTSMLGRIAIDVSPADPNRVYATVEAKTGSGFYRSDDKGATWTLMNTGANIVTRAFYFSRLVADPKDKERCYKPGLGLGMTEDGGKTFAGLGGGTHGDHHALWVNPTRPAELLLGTDGGVYVSEDQGTDWRFVGTIPAGQFYHAAADSKWPYNVVGGLQDNGTWLGPSNNTDGIGARHWKSVGFGDGFWALFDGSDEDYIYVEWQGGQLLRYRQTTGEAKNIAPMQRVGDPKLRYNWNTPMHVGGKSKALYYGAQFLYRSSDRGEHWDKISPDLTTNDPAKQRQEESGGVSVDNSSAENHCTLYTICESPLNADVIWVGTDDGNLQLTRDGGKSWVSLAKNVPGLPPTTWVSRVEASRFAEGTAYATFDGHATGDMQTHVYVTRDYGRTWVSLATPDLKWYAHVIKEDLVNPNLLFLGTEWGLYVSVDQGKQWGQLTPGLPVVAVRDLAFQPREGDLIIATHGRSLYVLDDLSPLRALTPQVLDQDFAFLPGRAAVQMLPSGEQRFDSDQDYVGPTLPDAAYVNYYLKKRHIMGDLKVEMYDAQGNLVTALPGNKRRGINRVELPMRLPPVKAPAAANFIRQPGAFLGPRVPAGDYTVKVIKGDKTYTTTIKIAPDPRSTYTADERALQNTTVRKLYGMMGDLTYLADAVTDARQQGLDRAAKLAPKDAARKSLDAFNNDLNNLRNTLSANREGLLTGEEKIRERLGSLYGNVNFYDGPPSGSQLDNIKVVEGELNTALDRYKVLSEKSLPAVNAALVKAKLDPIAPMSRKDWEAKQSGGGSGKSSSVDELMMDDR